MLNGSTAVTQGTEILLHTRATDPNIDHDVCTIDGANIIHGMDFIGIKLPDTKISVSSAEVAAIGHISIEYSKSSTSLPLLVYKTICKLKD